MGQYYSVAVLSRKTVYHLGTRNSARRLFIDLLDELSDKEKLVVYGDESYPVLQDQYEFKEGFKEVDYEQHSTGNRKELKDLHLTIDEFYDIFKEFGGNKWKRKDLLSEIKNSLKYGIE